MGSSFPKQSNDDAFGLFIAFRESLLTLLESNEEEVKSQQVILNTLYTSLCAIPASTPRFQVSIIGSYLGDVGCLALLEVLGTTKCVNGLSLVDCGITGEVVDALTDAVKKIKIVRLDLSKSNFTEEGIKFILLSLKKHRTLTTLILREVNVNGDELCKTIRTLINKNNFINSIDLSNNNIHEEGGKILKNILKKKSLYYLVKYQ